MRRSGGNLRLDIAAGRLRAAVITAAAAGI